jgi:hypothetical protein
MPSLEEKSKTGIILWNDESVAAVNLGAELLSKGYIVKSSFSGEREPTMQCGNNFYHGYGKIRTLFC